MCRLWVKIDILFILEMKIFVSDSHLKMEILSHGVVHEDLDANIAQALKKVEVQLDVLDSSNAAKVSTRVWI